MWDIPGLSWDVLGILGHLDMGLDCPGYLRTLGHGTSVDVHYVDCPGMSWVS